ncbi:MAG: TatD family hydrolase [Spirochaetota bacterium]
MDKISLFSGIVDTHFHMLEMKKKGLDPDQILSYCFQNGLTAALDVAVKAERFQERLEICYKYPELFLTAGLSPAESGKTDAIKLQTLETQIRDPSVIAVGEIGLDRHWNYADPETQKKLFITQIELANQYNLPIVVHNRNADREIFHILRDIKVKGRGVIHCFSSDYEAAKAFIKLGFTISFSGSITYKNAVKIRETAQKIPLDYLFLETDAPFLSPQPVRGMVNHPGYIGYTYEFLAQQRGIHIADLITIVRSNFSSLFRINL